jgi:hypothetical protein
MSPESWRELARRVSARPSQAPSAPAAGPGARRSLTHGSRKRTVNRKERPFAVCRAAGKQTFANLSERPEPPSSTSPYAVVPGDPDAKRQVTSQATKKANSRVDGAKGMSVERSGPPMPQCGFSLECDFYRDGEKVFRCTGSWLVIGPSRSASAGRTPAATSSAFVSGANSHWRPSPVSSFNAGSRMPQQCPSTRKASGSIAGPLM